MIPAAASSEETVATMPKSTEPHLPRRHLIPVGGKITRALSAASNEPARTDHRLLGRRCAAAAAVIGGSAWALKAGAVLAAGDEPPLAFAVGLVLFPFVLVGLRSVVGSAGKRAAHIGGVLAAIAALCAVLALLVRAVGGEGVEPSEDDVTLLTPLIVGASVGAFLALIALGIAVRRTRALAPRYASLPLAMGVGAVPLLIVGAALESVSERLIELPIALLGLCWIGLGIALWKAAHERAAGAPAVGSG